MNITVKESFDYVPEWNGNREKPKDEQIVVSFKFLTGLDVMDIYSTGKLDKIKDWSARCTNVTNLKYNGEVVTPEILISKPGLASLYSELFVMFSKEKEINIDKKKLKSVSGSPIVEKKKS